MAVLSFRTDVLHSEEDFDSSVDEIIKLFSIYFPVVRCIMHEKAVLSFKSVVQGTQNIFWLMNAIKQYPQVFPSLYRETLTFAALNEIL